MPAHFFLQNGPIQENRGIVRVEVTRLAVLFDRIGGPPQAGQNQRPIDINSGVIGVDCRRPGQFRQGILGLATIGKRRCEVQPDELIADIKVAGTLEWFQRLRKSLEVVIVFLF